MILVGCCGFRKAHKTYFQHYRLIEIQKTFYRPPKVETALRWRAEAPPDFTFTLKAWQWITHPPGSPTYRRAGFSIPPESRPRYGYFRPTDEVLQAWERTRAIARALDAPVVVFQCPPSFTPTQEHIRSLRAFFSSVKREGLRFAWEPRGRWPDELVRELCQQLELIHCVDPFVRRPVTEGLAYFRLHGVTGYRYRFSDADLTQLKECCRPFERAYVLFNNLSMWEDGLRFQEM